MTGKVSASVAPELASWSHWSMQREQSPLVQRTEAFEDSLREIKSRWYYLTAMHAELERVSRGKTFRVMNSIAWQMAFDSNDMLVNWLASWVTQQTEPGGLFGLLNSRLNELARKLPKKRTRNRERFLVRYNTEAHDQAVRRLFPESSGRIAQGSDVDALRARLTAECEGLIHDRNRNRAHPLDGTRESVDRLKLSEVGELFERIERALNDVRLIADSTRTSFGDINSTCAEAAARDFVDTVLVGSSARQELVMAGVMRDAFFERLHELHDADAKPSPEVFFNDYEVEPIGQAAQRQVVWYEARRADTEAKRAEWKKDPAPAPTDAGQDSGGNDSDDEEDVRDA